MGAEAREHGFEALAVGVGDGDEPEAEASTAADVANEGVGLDAALLHEELEFGWHAFFDLEVRRLDEEAVDADVEDAGDIVAAVALPADPDVLGSRKARKSTA
jgi:hypothetical protein